MATSSIDLEDFICSICREIFQKPVSLACSHCYCQRCVSGLKKPGSSDIILAQSEISQISKSVIYKPKVLESNQCFICAMCRVESFGYTECRDIEADLRTLVALCSHCSKGYVLCELRKHTELCETKRKIKPTDFFKLLNPNVMSQLSQPQAEALQKARAGENRSTFPCPYCAQANFTVEDLCQHIEENHLDDNHCQVCTICAAMPWGNRYRRSENVYEHIYNRHRFNYDTYVNFDQDEDSMTADAIEKSLTYQ